jgi:hypothetical protein
MALRRLTAALLSTLGAFALAAGCGSDATGVDECRDIEEARCEAGKPCGLVDDVEGCKRFYRDQCLHGLSSGEKPGKPVVDDCVNAIKRAGDCAAAGFVDLVECVDPLIPPTTGTALTKVCDVVKKPEKIIECDFLYKPVELPDGAPETSTDDGGSDTGSTDDASDSTTADAPGE